MRFIVLFWLLLAGLVAASPAFGQLAILTEEHPPYNYTDHGRLTGATTRVVEEILRRLGSNDRIEVMPWARGYERLRTEPNVVLFTTARTPEREEQFQWVGPLFSFRLGFYARKSDHLQLDSLDAAKKVASIATYRADFREQLLTELGFTNLENSNSPESNVRKLASGRVTLWFFDNVGAPKVARDAGVDFESIEEVFTCQQLFSYIAFSKQTPADLVRRWQATLDEMKADGTFWWLTSSFLPADAIVAERRENTTGVDSGPKPYTEVSPPSSTK